MTMQRPDLSQVPPEVRDYIEQLEAELERMRGAAPVRARHTVPAVAEEAIPEPEFEPSEPPTTLSLITVSGGGLIKRTPRHVYDRQRRGGMGIFDLDSPESDPPAFLTIADRAETLVMVTNQGRAFPFQAGQLPDSPIRARGQPLGPALPLVAGERLAVVFPDQGAGYLILVTQRGQVRRIRYHYFGRALQPGAILYDVREGGAPAAVCWSPGDRDIFIATRSGSGIRFAEQQIPVRGCLGIRIDPDDAAVGVAAVEADGGVFLIGADGRGTTRLMAGFAKNKEPGGGGKVAMKTDRLVGAAGVREGDDIFVISRLSKIIRFASAEVPAKEGVVQGVNCMALRADETVALAVASLPSMSSGSTLQEAAR